MKVAIILSLLIVAAVAHPQGGDARAEILSMKNENPGDGNYDFGYTSSDGTKREEHGELKKIGDEYGQTANGVIEWTSPEGEKFSIQFVADENGFRPVGAHLPK